MSIVTPKNIQDWIRKKENDPSFWSGKMQVITKEAADKADQDYELIEKFQLLNAGLIVGQLSKKDLNLSKEQKLFILTVSNLAYLLLNNLVEDLVEEQSPVFKTQINLDDKS